MVNRTGSTDPSQSTGPRSKRSSHRPSRRTILSTIGSGITVTALPRSSSIGTAHRTDRKTIRVTKDGVDDGFAAYYLSTTDTIGPGDDAEAVTVGSSALDTVGPKRGTDTFHYTGELDTVLLKGPATITVDGRPLTEGVSPARTASDRTTLENTLTVTKDGAESGLAACTAAVSGAITPTETAEAVSNGSTVLDHVGPERGRDTFRYSGDLTELLLNGPATVTVNGTRVTPEDINAESAKPARVVPQNRETTVAPGTPVHFELRDPAWDGERSVRSEWWVNGELRTDSFMKRNPVQRSMFPPERDYFHHQFDESGTYTVEGALLPDDENTIGEADVPPERRVTWTVTVREGGNRAPLLAPRSPDTTVTVDRGSQFTLAANVLDPDGKLDRVHWRYRLGDVYLDETPVSGTSDVAALTFEEFDFSGGAFQLLAANTTGAFTDVFLWRVPMDDAPYVTVVPNCTQSVRGYVDQKDDCA